jgi:DNA polymerase III delta prime subunit
MKLNPNFIVERLKIICKLENVSYEKPALKHIADISCGDMRNAINMLQLLYNKCGTVKYKDIGYLSDMPQPHLIKKLFDAIIKTDLKKSLTITKDLRNDGYCGSDITLGMIHTLKTDVCDHIREDIKLEMLDIISVSAYKISKGTDSILQLVGCIATLIEFTMTVKNK